MKETMIKDFTVVRGDTFSMRMKSLDDELDIDEIHFSCKKRKTDTDYVFHKTMDNGGVTYDSDGLYTLKASPADMDIAEGIYYYDVQVDFGNDIKTPLMGRVRIIKDVTDNE